MHTHTQTSRWPHVDTILCTNIQTLTNKPSRNHVQEYFLADTQTNRHIEKQTLIHNHTDIHPEACKHRYGWTHTSIHTRVHFWTCPAGHHIEAVIKKQYPSYITVALSRTNCSSNQTVAVQLQYCHLSCSMDNSPGIFLLTTAEKPNLTIYCSISPLSFMDVVSESAMNWHFLINNLCANGQFGFHQEHSDPDHNRALIKNCTEELNFRGDVGVIGFDINATFD